MRVCRAWRGGPSREGSLPGLQTVLDVDVCEVFAV